MDSSIPCSSAASALTTSRRCVFRCCVAARSPSEDVADRPQVAVVSKRFADTLLQGTDPVGQILLRSAPNQPPVTVVGVAEDALDVNTTTVPEPTLYLPWAQSNNSGVPIAFVIRSSVDPSSLVSGSARGRARRRCVAAIAACSAARRVRAGIDRARSLSIARARHHRDAWPRASPRSASRASPIAASSIARRSSRFGWRSDRSPAGVVRLVVAESMRDLTIGVDRGNRRRRRARAALLARLLENVAAVDALTSGRVDPADPGCRHRRGSSCRRCASSRVQPAEVLRS